jgi:hypothetical protein
MRKIAPEPKPTMRLLTVSLVAVSALTLTACGSLRQSVGLTKVVPDEFVTVSTAPLTVPPEYGLRPPAPGQPRPQELAPESAARQILLGQRQSITRSPGETALVTAAGADRADPLARYVIDDEFGDLAHKEQSFADRILFWRRDDASTQAPTQTQTAQGAVTIDAATEAERLRALTGGQRSITIQPRREGGFKLPGL